MNGNVNRENLIKILRKFMIDVYANLTTRQDMEVYLRQNLGLQVLSGQKRLIVLTGNTVLKIAYDRDGLMDNMNEVICSNRLRELRQQGAISEDQLQLFGLCEVVNNSPFVIEMQAGTNFNDDPEFVAWYKRMMGVNTKPDYSSDATWFPIYMAENQQLREDFKAQQEILSTYFVASDVNPVNEPRNETLVTRNSPNGGMTKRLFLIDMGSCFPVLQDQYGSYIRPTCPDCGSALIYVPYQLRADILASDTKDIVGKYGCTNQSCRNYYQSLPVGSPTINLEDSRILTIYQSTHMSTVRYMRAVECCYYMPTRRVNSRMDLANAFMNEFGLQQIDQTLLNGLWDNYIAKACGDVLGRNPEVMDVPFYEVNRMMTDYQNYRQKVAYVLQTTGEAVDNIAMRITGLIYLYALIESSGNGPSVIYDMMLLDQNSFIANLMNLGVQQGTAQVLYQDIMGNF